MQLFNVTEVKGACEKKGSTTCGMGIHQRQETPQPCGDLLKEV